MDFFKTSILDYFVAHLSYLLHMLLSAGWSLFVIKVPILFLLHYRLAAYISWNQAKESQLK